MFAQGYVAAGPGAGRFGGDEMMMLSNQTDSQMMSYVITTRKGDLIVIDGGVPGDAPHLEMSSIKRVVMLRLGLLAIPTVTMLEL